MIFTTKVAKAMHRVSIAAVLTFCMAGCSADPLLESSSHALAEAELMDAIDATVELPQGAEPFEAYGRYYRYDGDLILAHYLLPRSPRPPNEACVEMRADFESVPVPCPEIANGRDLRAGERKWVVDGEWFPTQLDGGCSMITIRYDAQAKQFVQVKCNGML